MSIFPDILKQEAKTKMLLIILDGLGGLPSKDGKTELETANTPNMDRLAKKFETGMSIPVEIGITPGSGPGHLGVFGYDPTDYPIGRGILEALGIDVNVDNKTVTARCNFCNIDSNGIITDRRAGRIKTEENIRLVKILNEQIKSINNKTVEFYSGIEHRFVFVIRDIETNADVNDTDPQNINLKPLEAISQNDSSDDVAEIINKAANLIGNVLKDESRANYALFRGISKLPNIETMKERFGIRSVCIATYPMYKGLSKLVGMDIVDGGKTIEDEIDALEKHYDNYDYFFFHVKKTDSYGEDGDFDKKVEVIERFDILLPKIEALNFDVISITGDHSTPAIMKAHSFHPVPLLIKHPYPRRNPVDDFSETECLKGSLGTIYAKHIINLMLAGADRLKKYGA